jgi:hypothetical protein
METDKKGIIQLDHPLINTLVTLVFFLRKVIPVEMGRHHHRSFCSGRLFSLTEGPRVMISSALPPPHRTFSHTAIRVLIQVQSGSALHGKSSPAK